MLCLVQKHQYAIGIAMGEGRAIQQGFRANCGQRHRLCGFGRAVSGQIDIEELCNVYCYRRLKKADLIYALLGDPVTYSMGHRIHNQILNKGVYVKLKLRPEEVGPFRELAAQLPFKGFSVTMPLKKLFAPGFAINTIAVHNSGWDFANTDGPAAAHLIEKHTTLHNKRCVILGAGGVADGFATSLIERG